MRYEFDEFIYDTGRIELRRGATAVHLTPKAMTLLELLIGNRPNVVSQQDLYDRLWPDVVVHHANLKNLVADLRCALGDHERNGRFIRTVHGRGYAFTEDVIVVAGSNGRRPASRAFLVDGTRRMNLVEGENVAGRAIDATLHLDNPSISRRHARILVEGERVTIEDLGSRNGTSVRGERVDAPVEIFDGDEIRLGFLAFTLQLAGREGDSETASWG
jgi:DNA-binding winged helix-turn-helix (wHTH) protein